MLLHSEGFCSISRSVSPSVEQEQNMNNPRKDLSSTVYIYYTSICNRRNSDLNGGIEVRVRRPRFLMSSRIQSLEIRTSSQRAPPLIMSFAFTSCWAMWKSASSMWRLIAAASLLAFCTIHGSAPSSIKNDVPLFIPWLEARDSHLAKLAIPRATCERTSGWSHLTTPSKALIPPSKFILSTSSSKVFCCLSFSAIRLSNYTSCLQDKLL